MHQKDRSKASEPTPLVWFVQRSQAVKQLAPTLGPEPQNIRPATPVYACEYHQTVNTVERRTSIDTVGKSNKQEQGTTSSNKQRTATKPDRQQRRPGPFIKCVLLVNAFLKNNKQVVVAFESQRMLQREGCRQAGPHSDLSHRTTGHSAASSNKGQQAQPTDQSWLNRCHVQPYSASCLVLQRRARQQRAHCRQARVWMRSVAIPTFLATADAVSR